MSIQVEVVRGHSHKVTYEFAAPPRVGDMVKIAGAGFLQVQKVEHQVGADQPGQLRVYVDKAAN